MHLSTSCLNTCSVLTRVLTTMGSSSSLLPFDDARASTVPVSTVPVSTVLCPGTAKQWSTARQNPPRASRSRTSQLIHSTCMRCAMPCTLCPGPTATGRTGTVASFERHKVCSDEGLCLARHSVNRSRFFRIDRRQQIFNYQNVLNILFFFIKNTK